LTHEKNDFSWRTGNFGWMQKSNFVELSKWLCRTFKTGY